MKPSASAATHSSASKNQAPASPAENQRNRKAWAREVFSSSGHHNNHGCPILAAFPGPLRTGLRPWGGILRQGWKPQISSRIAFALLVGFGLATLPCTAQSTPPQPAPQPDQPHQEKIIFSRSDSEAAPTPLQAPTKPMRADSEQLAPPQVAKPPVPAQPVPQVAFTLYDLDAHLRPADQQIAIRALLTVRNNGATPLARIPLQISSSLNWESVRVNAHNTVFHVATINSDADHTGQLHEAAIPLDAPLLPGQTIQIDATYSGVIALSAQRLQSIGAPDALALH